MFQIQTKSQHTYVFLLLLIAAMLAFFSLIIPTQVFATDSRCMPEEECIDIHVNSFGVPRSEVANVWTNNPRACGTMFTTQGEEQPGGFCFAIQSAETQISFFGQTTFENLGVFIAYLYRISFIIAMVLLTVILIASGIQWMTSGGGDGKSAAQKRIGQSIAGVGLLASSWLILNTINPALVQLRLPNAYIVRPDNRLPLRCEDVPGDRGFAEHIVQGPTRESRQITTFTDIIPTDYQPMQYYYRDATCGNEYFIEQGNGQICRSYHCPVTGEICGQWHTGDQQYSCEPINLAISVHRDSIHSLYNTTGFLKGIAYDTLLMDPDGSPWEWPFADDAQLLAVCRTPLQSLSLTPYTYVSIASNKRNAHIPDQQINRWFFQLETIVNAAGDARYPALEDPCNGEDFYGYVVRVDMNTEEDLSGSLVDLAFLGLPHAINPISQLRDKPHYIGVSSQIGAATYGVDLGRRAIFEALLTTEEVKEFFITPEQLIDGLTIAIEVNRVYRIEQLLTSADTIRDNMRRAYGPVGYQSYLESYEAAQSAQNNIRIVTGEQQQLYNAYANCFTTNRIQSCNAWDSLPAETRQDVIDNLDTYRQGYRCYWAMQGSTQFDRQRDCAHLQSPTNQ